MESVSRSSSTPPSAILSIIGGALMVASGILPLAMFGMWNQQGMMYGWDQSGMMGGGGFGMMAPLQSYVWIIFATMSAVSLGIGAILIIGGYSIYKNPASAGKWGVGILVGSIIGIFGMGGFFIGPILGIIGGILALTKK
jgi:hypothetical protein